MSGRSGHQEGFTLVELMVTVTILGVIGVTLAGAVILGFRTTDRTAARVGRASAVQALTSYFTEDAHRAEAVSTVDSSDCPTGDPGLFLRLVSTDFGVTTNVSYALDPPTGTDHQVIRWTCAGTGPAFRKVLGVISHDAGEPLPIAAACTPAPCPATPQGGGPTAVTLQIRDAPMPAPADPLTVRRRTT